MADSVHPVDEILPTPKLFTLGLQHVLVMYAGAVAVPLIIGRALQLSPEDVAFLISADLFVCGVATLIQSLGASQWFGIKLPVMMGVTFAAVGPMIAMANAQPGVDGARSIFGAIMAAGVISMLIAPFISRMLRFFPPVVTGTIILVIGVSLMRVGINWVFGVPVGPTAPQLVDPAHAEWLQSVSEGLAAGSATGITELPPGLSLSPKMNNPAYAPLGNMLVSGIVLAAILLIAKYGRGFVSNISVLLGIVIGGVIAAAIGAMDFNKVGEAPWFDIILPFHFGLPTFELVPIITMVLVMIVVMIESTGMFLALCDMTGRDIEQKTLSAGLRTDGLGTLIGGIFNTFPYTSFSQNVGLVGVTGIKSRFVCVAGGVILIGLGFLPKMAALIESLPTMVLGGAGIVMFGMVAATGVRILSAVNFAGNRNNLFIVAVSLGLGMIPLVAPQFRMWLPHAIHPLIESGILLASISAVLLNAFFNGAKGSLEEAKAAASAADH
ncbi:MAG: nucleobase:cation symporter-2 family protein [Pseudorhodobacter sp.]